MSADPPIPPLSLDVDTSTQGSSGALTPLLSSSFILADPLSDMQTYPQAQVPAEVGTPRSAATMESTSYKRHGESYGMQNLMAANGHNYNMNALTQGFAALSSSGPGGMNGVSGPQGVTLVPVSAGGMHVPPYQHSPLLGAGMPGNAPLYAMQSPGPAFANWNGYIPGGLNAYQAGFAPTFQMMPVTPPGHGQAPAGENATAQAETRRDSWSSSGSEHAPPTPYIAAGFQPEQAPRIAQMESSPSTGGMTFMPAQGPHDFHFQQALLQAHFANQYPRMKMVYDMPVMGPDYRIDMKVKEHPAIPAAIPAIFSHNTRTLAESLANPTNTTNVYIRGLTPDTTDDKLYLWCARFGKVVSHKAIIDTQHGTCKGYGFACYSTSAEAQECIKGFFYLKYEVGFARESFNTRLKDLADPKSTNLYISNIPRDMDETALNEIFKGFTVSSSRILRDSRNNSRGVGFARFEGRDVCEQVIANFHDCPVGPEGNLLQVRYADTEEQKKLKHETAKRRQFRTNEYNAVAHGNLFHAPVVMANFGRPVLGQLDSHGGNNWRSPRAINTPIKPTPVLHRLAKSTDKAVLSTIDAHATAKKDVHENTKPEESPTAARSNALAVKAASTAV